MSFTARQDSKSAAFFRTPDWFRLPDWLISHAPDFGHQASRVRSVERNIILPIKGAIIALLVWFLFFSRLFDDVYTFRDAVLLTVRLFFLIYAVVNLAVAIVLMGMDELPFKLIREVVLVEAVVDILFWGALTVVTGGVGHMVFLEFLGVVIPESARRRVAADRELVRY